jgi:hypothetical protein
MQASWVGLVINNIFMTLIDYKVRLPPKVVRMKLKFEKLKSLIK